MGSYTVVRLLERVLAVWAELCRLGWGGGSRDRKAPGLSGCLDVWGCSSGMAGGCFISGIPAL